MKKDMKERELKIDLCNFLSHNINDIETLCGRRMDIYYLINNEACLEMHIMQMPYSKLMTTSSFGEEYEEVPYNLHQLAKHVSEKLKAIDASDDQCKFAYEQVILLENIPLSWFKDVYND